MPVVRALVDRELNLAEDADLDALLGELAAELADRANLLLAELVGAALHDRAAVRVTTANVGSAWPRVMETESVGFAPVDP